RQLARAARTCNRQRRIVAGRERDKLRRRIEMAERAADRAAVASLSVSDLQQGLVHYRPARAHRIREFQITLARHGADLKRTVDFPDVGESFHAIEIDDVIGLDEAKVE